MLSRTQLAASDRRWAVKLALRAFTIIASLIVLSCHAWIITGYSEFAYWAAGWILGLVLIAGCSIIWCSANITVTLFRSKPMHPGANVACELIIWMVYTTGSVITSLFTWYYYGYYQSLPITRYASSSIAYQRSKRYAIHVYNVRAAGAVFAYLAVILHFTFFVMACIECDRYNKSKKDWKANKLAEHAVSSIEQQHNPNNILIANRLPIYAPIPQIYGIDAQQPPQQVPLYQQQTQYQGPVMPNYGPGYMAVPQQAALYPPPPPGTVGIEVPRGGNYI